MKELALLCGLLSGVFGVISALAFLSGSRAMPWDLQTWKGQTQPEIDFRAKAQRRNRAGLFTLATAFIFSAVSAIASYYS